MRGIRGAITVKEDTREEIWQAAARMVRECLEKNQVDPQDIGAAIFSMTEDLTAAFPSAGVRKMLAGFDAVPLFDMRQLAIKGSLQRCIRVLLLVNTQKEQKEIHHVYLEGAATLRPDLSDAQA